MHAGVGEQAGRPRSKQLRWVWAVVALVAVVTVVVVGARLQAEPSATAPTEPRSPAGATATAGTPTPSPTPTPTPTPTGPALPVIEASVAGEYAPGPEEATEDIPDHYVDECHQLRPESEPEACVYGDPDAGTVVALVGDSHAAQWQPGLREVAQERGWRLEVYTKSACPLADQEVWIRKDDKPYTSCTEWNERTLAALTEDDRPDLVVTTTSGEYDAVVDGEKVDAGSRADELIAAGTARSWDALEAADIPVVVLMDTPWYPLEVGPCVAENPEEPAVCDAPRASAVADSGLPIIAAAADLATAVDVIDLTDTMCNEDLCAAVVDGMLVMRDEHHITATFSRFLAPWILHGIQQAWSPPDGR